MDILVVGGGGREHAIIWALAKALRQARFIVHQEMQESHSSRSVTRSR